MEHNYSLLGNEDLLNKNATAFLCSHKVPDATFDAIRKWIDSLNPEEDCVICGCLAGIEKFTLKYLLQKKIPIILAIAEAMPPDVRVISNRLSGIILSEAMGSGRLLCISCTKDMTDIAANGKNAEARNKMMISLSKRLVVGYATPIGSLSKQLLTNRNVTYLISSNVPVDSSGTPQDSEKEYEKKVNMGWGIYDALKENYATLGSLEARKLLNQYLQLGINRPSRLHSLILLLVVKNIDVYPELKFAAFFRLWGYENLQTEDWKAQKYNDHWLPSLAERVTGRLLRYPEGGSYRDIDCELVRIMLDKAAVMAPHNKKFMQYREKLEKIERWRQKGTF